MKNKKDELYYKVVDVLDDGREITIRELIECKLMELFENDYIKKVDELEYDKLVRLIELLGFENELQ